jgi:hypothetical protein
MKNLSAIRERYLRDPLPVRLGGLAANLRRIHAFAAQEAGRSAVESLTDESKFFIEWTAAEAETATAAELVALQIQLAGWQRKRNVNWMDPEQRRGLAEQAGAWSRRVLELSGLLQR